MKDDLHCRSFGISFFQSIVLFYIFAVMKIIDWMRKSKVKYFWFLPFILFAGLTFFSSPNESNRGLRINQSDSVYYINGLAKKELDNVKFIADYWFDIHFEELYDRIIVSEKIIWRNSTQYSADEIQFHLYANAYKNDKTLFSEVYKITEEAKTSLEIESVLLNGVAKELIYFQPDVQNPYDSTVAKILCDSPIEPGDSAIITFKFKLKIPVSIKRFGKARDADFYFVSQWYPKVGVFENGKWTCNQYFPRLNFYADFGRYHAMINLPDKYKLVSTGIIKKSYTSNKRTTFEVVQNGVHDFAWSFASEIIDTSRKYLRKEGSSINVRLFVPPDKEGYIERYFNSTLFTLKYFEEHVGDYPYQQVTLVDVPRSSASGGMEYPTLFTVTAGLFEPEETHFPEKLVMHEFIHQYFYGIIANNETKEAWLDEGFASYYASKTAASYFDDNASLTFNAFGYLPIYGINYFDLYEIPIIYSLGRFEYPEEGRALRRYYSDKLTGAIADTSYKLPTVLSYVINAYSKPELMLHSLERVMGKEKFDKAVKFYFNKFKFKHPKSEDFIAIAKRFSDKNIDWFFNETFYSSKLFDDRIRYIKEKDKGEYEIFLERLGDGNFVNDLSVYTETDTLKYIWKGGKRFKILNVKTDSEILSAEIDPERKNLFDVNYSNNSFTLEEKYWGALSISIKWFFWIQNALMILGSIG